jgi:integrase
MRSPRPFEDRTNLPRQPPTPHKSGLCITPEYATRGLSRIAIKNHTNAIRAFLRYAGSRGWCSSSIAEGIQGPRIYAQEDLPGGPSWDEIKRLVSSLDTDTPADIRGRAVIMLFAIYGVRASEVRRLRLEHIDWEHDQLVVPRYKEHCPRVSGRILQHVGEQDTI